MMSIVCNFHAVSVIKLVILSGLSVGCRSTPFLQLQNPSKAMTAILALHRGEDRLKRSGETQAASQGQSFVNLTLRLREGEKPEIVRTTQVEGKLVERQGPSSEYVYEITKHGKGYSVGFLPQGGFELRGFGEPGDNPKEIKGGTNSTTVILSIPNTSLDDLRGGGIGLRIYKIKPGIELEAISVKKLKRLVLDKVASVRTELEGPAIAKHMKSSQQ